MVLGGGLNALIPPQRGGAAHEPPVVSPAEPAPVSPSAPLPVPPPVPLAVHSPSPAVPRLSGSAGSSFARDPFDRATGAGAGMSREHPAPRGPRNAEESVFQIEVETIEPNPYQPRRDFEPRALGELAESIRNFGILQPLVVTKVVRETSTGTDVGYQLIAGERRLEAAKLAGLERVPAIVRRVDERRAKLELALIENVQRSDLNPVEAARAYARLQEEFGLTQREVAARVGKSREVVANALRLLQLPVPVLSALAQGKLNESQARTLLSLGSSEVQLAALTRILSGGLSVRALRREVPGAPVPTQTHDTFLARQLEEKIGAPVSIARLPAGKAGEGVRGRITVQFYSDEELRGIVDRLGISGEMS